MLFALAPGAMPGWVLAEHVVHEDRRVLVERLNPAARPGRPAGAFLNGVGAVWAYGIEKSGGGYAASTGDRAATGFLVDRCHVLTNMHVAYDDAVVIDPSLGHPVAFGAGQTESDTDRGALQGLKFLFPGVVVAHGNSLIVDGLIKDPAEDWAVIRLASNADPTLEPLQIVAVEPGDLPGRTALSTAGYPADHRARRGNGFKLKDLWRSDGEVVSVVAFTSAALVQTTLQTTPGNSGGPIFGNFGGRDHAVIGMVQSFHGNGIDVSDQAPNVALLFTAAMLEEINAARVRYPCP